MPEGIEEAQAIVEEMIGQARQHGYIALRDPAGDRRVVEDAMAALEDQVGRIRQTVFSNDLRQVAEETAQMAYELSHLLDDVANEQVAASQQNRQIAGELSVLASRLLAVDEG